MILTDGPSLEEVHRAVVFNDERNRAELSRRLQALKIATEIVAPIVEKHDLKQYASNANIVNSGYPRSPVDQHISHILTVADWLLDHTEVTE